MKTTLPPLTRAEIASLSPADLLVELARRGIKTPTDPSFLREITTCPHCGHEGPVEKDFGIRILRGAAVPQSWCRPCRSNPDRVNSLNQQPTPTSH